MCRKDNFRMVHVADNNVDRSVGKAVAVLRIQDILRQKVYRSDVYGRPVFDGAFSEPATFPEFRLRIGS